MTVSREMLGGKATDSRGLNHYAGVTTGRVTGRMLNTFSANGKTYTLAQNDGPNNIHGGKRGWNDYNWDVKVLERSMKLSDIVKLNAGQADVDLKGLTFSRTSPDLEEGFPGTLEAKSTYLVSECDKLIFFWEVEFAKGQPDLRTPLSMTNHALWNISGNFKENIRSHDMKLNCHKWLPADSISMPTGEMLDVTGTPYDFRGGPNASTFLNDAKRFDGACDGGGGSNGIDNNMAIDRPAGSEGKLVETVDLSCKGSGNRMTISTTQNALELYTGNFLQFFGLEQYGAFALETTGFFSAANNIGKPGWPPEEQTMLINGKKYHHATMHDFNKL